MPVSIVDSSEFSISVFLFVGHVSLDPIEDLSFLK